MMTRILVCAAAAVLCGVPALADSSTEVAGQLLALERQAMEGWLKGDPGPLLAMSDPEITYFHEVTRTRLDGLPAVKALCEQYRGMPLFDSYEIAEPKVQLAGDVAVLTYRLVTRNGTATSLWNATQVYQRKKEGWRVIHSHWSMVKPAGAGQ
jgi:ketosteroid isomerase-like protein